MLQQKTTKKKHSPTTLTTNSSSESSTICGRQLLTTLSMPTLPLPKFSFEYVCINDSVRFEFRLILRLCRACSDVHVQEHFCSVAQISAQSRSVVNISGAITLSI